MVKTLEWENLQIQGLLLGECFEGSSESFHRVGSCYVGGQLILIPDGPDIQ
jgi:hypothetical protein